jgi:hypothetical protein
LAAWKGHVELVKVLLAAGAEPLIKNKRGETAAQVAEASKAWTREIVDIIVAHIDGQKDKEDL